MRTGCSLYGDWVALDVSYLSHLLFCPLDRINDLRNPNAFFISCAKKYLPGHGDKGRQNMHGAHGAPYHNQGRGQGSYQRGPPPSSGVQLSRPYERERGSQGTGGGIEQLPENLQQCAREVRYSIYVCTSSLF